jgi:hypothetical protein
MPRGKSTRDGAVVQKQPRRNRSAKTTETEGHGTRSRAYNKKIAVCCLVDDAVWWAVECSRRYEKWIDSAASDAAVLVLKRDG